MIPPPLTDLHIQIAIPLLRTDRFGDRYHPDYTVEKKRSPLQMAKPYFLQYW
jgi:hypothetical protein